MAEDMKSWLVKDFPVALREKINQAAYDAHVTVPAWLVNYFNTYGIGGEVINVKPPPAKPRNGGAAEGDLNPLLHAVAAVLAATGGKLGAVPGLHSLVSERVREARGLEPAAPKQPRLKAIAAPPAAEVEELTSAKHSEVNHPSSPVEDANPIPEDRSETALAAE